MQGTSKLNDAWKSACKVILGNEVGELKDCEEFLKRYVMPIKKTKSALSGKEVYYGAPYSEKAKFISMNEIEQIKVKPLDINDMKDADSLFRAASERFYYSGNKLGGKVTNIEKSEDCSDAHNVLDSTDIFLSENIAYCQMLKEVKYAFGTCWGTTFSFAINTTEIYKTNRAFESTLTTNSADVYYSYNCNSCQEVMFCINQKTVRNAIGNVALPKDRYLIMKKKLLEDIAQMLKSKKTAPSHIDVLLGKIT